MELYKSRTMLQKKELRWWDKDEKWMKENISKFWSIDEFMKFAGEPVKI